MKYPELVDSIKSRHSAEAPFLLSLLISYLEEYGARVFDGDIDQPGFIQFKKILEDIIEELNK